MDSAPVALTHEDVQVEEVLSADELRDRDGAQLRKVGDDDPLQVAIELAT